VGGVLKRPPARRFVLKKRDGLGKKEWGEGSAQCGTEASRLGRRNPQISLTDAQFFQDGLGKRVEKRSAESEGT